MPEDRQPESASGHRGRVLVVDDQESLRRLIRLNLELEGFEVVEAWDGIEGLAEARRQTPDLITLDLVMPRLDGMAAAAALHADPVLDPVPVVMVTTSGHPADLVRARAAGIDAYLTKPFDPDELVEIVHRLLVSPI